jgi:hypothetical protein
LGRVSKVQRQERCAVIDGGGGAISDRSIDCEEHAVASLGGKQRRPFEAQGKRAAALHMRFAYERISRLSLTG